VKNLLKTGAFCLAGLLAGCNSWTNTSYQTIKLAIGGPESVITTDMIDRLGQTGLIARLGQGEALLVLAGRYGSTSEWHGPSQFLVTRNGKLVQTVGAPDQSDLLTALAANDPFSGDLRAVQEGQETTRFVDFPERYMTGLPQHARYTIGPIEVVEVMGLRRKAQRLDESIAMPTLDFEATNYYWIDPATGKVLASKQYIAPDQPPLYLTEVSPTESRP